MLQISYYCPDRKKNTKENTDQWYSLKLLVVSATYFSLLWYLRYLNLLLLISLCHVFQGFFLFFFSFVCFPFNYEDIRSSKGL